MFEARARRLTGVGVLLLAVTASTVVTVGTSVRTTEAAVVRPNVIFVVADDMRPDEMARVADLKPNGGFDWVRDNGVRFDRHFSTDNLCCPGRTTLLTGQTAYHHKVFTNDTYKDLQKNTLPIWLRGVNYCTGFTGKYLNHYGPNRPRPGGWTFWEPLAGNGIDEYNYSIMRRDGTTWKPGVFVTDQLAKVSRAQLTDCLNTGRSAFLALWPVAPHVGSEPEPDYANVAVPWSSTDPSFNEADISDKPGWLQSWYPNPREFADLYFAGIATTRVRTLLSVDDALKSLINILKLRGKLTNTVIVLTSDNGDLLGEHRVSDKKNLAYDAAQPGLWIAGPGFPKGVASDAFTTNLDVAPTILRSASADTGFSYITPWDGRKLQTVLAEPDLAKDRFLPIYVPAGELPLQPSPQGDAVRTWRYKYVAYADGSKELYDLFLDPYEETNAIDDPAYDAIEAAMVALLPTAMACRAGSCRVSAPLALQQ